MPLISTRGAASAQGFGEFAQSAAPVYIEDVFSTYLYTGNGSTQTITNGIALGDKFVGTSTYFNGSAYLSRSSDLSGNSDGKTFTFSVWVYVTSLATDSYVYTIKDGATNKFHISVLTDGKVNIRGYDNVDGSSRLNVDLPANSVIANQWTNILISFDLTSTSTRFVYVNDVAVTPTYFTYQNYNLDFTANNHYIAALSATTGKLTGYMTNVYLDYTYRDLSVTANRRYFIDSNGCSTPSSTLSALSPILYLPLTSSTTINSGTGGNFTANSSPVISDKGTDFVSGYGKGGLVWMKGRSGATDHALYDTTRGATKDLASNSSAAETTQATGLTAFSGTGFSIGALAKLNTDAATYASWTFRKQAKFFDIVTYTGTGANRTVAHNLGSVPGCIIVKRTNSPDNWQVYHRANTTAPETDYLVLNTTDSTVDDITRWNDTLPTSTEFSLGTSTTVNASGSTYVAYLFAHDAGGFGLSGTDNVISCGHYTSTDGTSPITVTLGFEPQWILVKSTGNSSANWNMFDVMRGWPVGGNGQKFRTNTSAAETTEYWFEPTATGFIVRPGSNLEYNEAGGYRYIYIAIRRGPMKVPTSGTQVYEPLTNQPLSGGLWNHNILTDFSFYHWQNGTQNWGVQDRLRGSNDLSFNSTAAENGLIGGNSWDVMNGYKNPNPGAGAYNSWAFRRAPGFFDVVCYTGTGSNRTVSHNLGVVPELIIVKGRSQAGTYWVVRHPSLTAGDVLILNLDYASTANSTVFTTTAPTASVFSVGTNDSSNASGQTLVAYLFATVAGVSKVGSYTGTGTTQVINCGFTAGSRFVLIKRTDSTGDWYVWDSARGIVAGNDPYVLLNSAATNVTGTDYIDTAATGFEISSTAPAALNANGGTFIFLAVA